MWSTTFLGIFCGILCFNFCLAKSVKPATSKYDSVPSEQLNPWSEFLEKRGDLSSNEHLMNMLQPLRKMPNQKWIDLGWSWGGK